MKEILLKDGEFALVDDEDYQKLVTFRWRNQQGYAKCGIWDKTLKRSRTVAMHRIILNPAGTMQVDHINGNRLDNSSPSHRLP